MEHPPLQSPYTCVCGRRWINGDTGSTPVIILKEQRLISTQNLNTLTNLILILYVLANSNTLLSKLEQPPPQSPYTCVYGRRRTKGDASKTLDITQKKLQLTRTQKLSTSNVVLSSHVFINPTTYTILSKSEIPPLYSPYTCVYGRGWNKNNINSTTTQKN